MIQIGANEFGIVRKKFGAQLPPGQHIALNGEAGYQADILPTGTYFKYISLQYEVRIERAIEVPPGEIALVFAKDGEPIPSGRILGRAVDCNDFQDARAFLENGGERGRQLSILKEGNYRINTELFTVITSANASQHNMKPEDFRVYEIDKDKIGIVTTKDGQPIPADQIACPYIQGHNKFQDPQQFIDRGGYRGLQEEFLTAGSWNLNPWFVDVKPVPLTEIPTGAVGVVISSVGKDLQQPGNHLVERGYKGIWKTPLPAMTHPINTEVMKVVIVPTHEIALDWSDKDKDATNYDANLQAIKLSSQDGFPFFIEVTQTIKIPEENAPQMISRIVSEGVTVSDLKTGIDSSPQKFSSIRNLVTRVLEPMVRSSFQIAAEGYDLMDFKNGHGERQREVEQQIKQTLSEYGVDAVKTSISEIDLPDNIEKLLRERSEIQQRSKNYDVKIDEQKKRQEYEHRKAVADSQKDLVAVELKAGSIRAIGQAEAEVLGAKLRAEVDALGGPQYYLAKVRAENLPQIQLPQVLVDSNGSHSGLLDAFVAPMLLGNPITQLPLLNPAIGGKQPALPTTGSTKLPQLQASLPRYPIVLLLDTSSSMPEEYLERLVQGINTFDQELVKDETVCRCVEVAIVTLSNSAKVVQSFTTAGNFSVHELELSGTAATGRGIELALKIIENRKSIYKNQNLPLCPPWIVLITGSAPSDHWQNAAQQVKQEVAAKQLNFLAVGVEGADMDILNQISPPQFPATMLKDWKFAPLFHGLAHQMKRIIHYQEKEALLQGLVQVVEQAKSALSPEQAKKLDEYTTKLMIQVSKEQPSRQEYTDNAAGLYREARDIGEDGKPITELLPNITKRLGFS
ncbi:SPFH domain-containing protein [Moorena producens]|uniref:SPFH domain-containing protein n=1 Tax=Moorena producens TaxID=1155739 RepID=UPI003C792F63